MLYFYNYHNPVFLIKSFKSFNQIRDQIRESESHFIHDAISR